MQNAAFIVIGLGVVVLIGWLARSFFLADDILLWIRIVAGIVVVAFVLLFGIVIKDRIVAAKKEDFKEVDK